LRNQGETKINKWIGFYFGDRDPTESPPQGRVTAHHARSAFVVVGKQYEYGLTFFCCVRGLLLGDDSRLRRLRTGRIYPKADATAPKNARFLARPARRPTLNEQARRVLLWIRKGSNEKLQLKGEINYLDAHNLCFDLTLEQSLVCVQQVGYKQCDFS
jgi:hypothetical protein